MSRVTVWKGLDLMSHPALQVLLILWLRVLKWWKNQSWREGWERRGLEGTNVHLSSFAFFSSQVSIAFKGYDGAFAHACSKKKKFALQTAGHHIQDDANKSVLLHSEFALNTKSLEPLLAIFVRRRQVSALQSYISWKWNICGTNHPLMTPLLLGLPLAEVSAT